MSLTVCLITKKTNTKISTGIFVRENGGNRELTPAEVQERYPGFIADAVECESREWYSANITHNLNKMAYAAGLYTALWQPEEAGIKYAYQLISTLATGLDNLLESPDFFKQYNPENGWGNYDGFVEFVAEYLEACKSMPNARVEVSR